MVDLVLLVADRNMKGALEGALSQPARMGIRPITFDIDVHPDSDGGIRTTGPRLLDLRRTTENRGLLVLDHEGSGAERIPALKLEATLDAQLFRTWGDRAKAIVIEPELEVWMWGSDSALSQVIGKPDDVGIREWLRAKDFTFTENDKPVRPKEAMDRILPHLGKRHSSSLYRRIAETISLHRCTDPAFKRLRTTLGEWFPER
jgi:hypothetical protein